MRVLALLLFLIPPAQAQQGGGTIIGIAHPPKGNGTITGHVLFADTRAPARGTRILLSPLTDLDANQGGQNLSTGTDLDGGYTIHHVPPGDYVVSAIAPGYLSPLDGILFAPGEKDQKASDAELRKVGNPVRVDGSSSVRRDLELVRGATFSGKVLYADGQPSAQSKILLQKIEKIEKIEDTPVKEDKRVDAGSFLRAILQQQQPRTDDLGNFRISGVPPGKYRLAVVQALGTGDLAADLMAAMTGSTSAKTLIIYSPSALHRKDATAYEVGPGDVRDGLQIVLPLGGLHQVSGRITGKQGIVVDLARLLLTDTTDPALQFSATLKQGEFLMDGIPDGTYELAVTRGRSYKEPPTEFDQIEDLDRFLQPTHAFADARRSLIVKDSDLENIDLVLDETTLPKTPKPITIPDPQD